MTACRTIISQIKVVASLGDVIINNALTFENGILQFRGPLVQDTEVTGNYKLTFGTAISKLGQFNVLVQDQLSIGYNNIGVGSELKFSSTGVLLTNTLANARGLDGASDFSANYTNLTYIQKIYADSKIVSRAISAELASPGVGQNSYAIIWDHGNSRFTLAPAGSISAGADTQVIFNNAGTLAGNANLTFASDILNATNINLGLSSIAGTDRTIQVLSSAPNVSLTLKTKGTGNLNLSLLQGKIILGDSASSNTNHIITANGAGAIIDISLEPKGTEGRVYIGNEAEAGAFRYIKSRGNLANVGIVLEAKGIGDLQLSVADDTDGTIGNIILGSGNSSTAGTRIKQLYAISGYQITNLHIGGTGVTSQLLIGRITENASTRYIAPGSSAINCNLNLIGKGVGLVAVNNVVNYKKIDIGDWDMDANDGKAIPHGLPDYKKIVNVIVTIRNDGDTSLYPLYSTELGLGVVEGGIRFWDSTSIHLSRQTGGLFDSTFFNNTGYNRGWVFISYEL